MQQASPVKNIQALMVQATSAANDVEADDIAGKTLLACIDLVRENPTDPASWDTWIYALEQLGKPQSDIAHVEMSAQRVIPSYLSPLHELDRQKYHNNFDAV